MTFPSHPVADALFERLGGAQPVEDETAFDVFSALTGTLTTHYAYLAAPTSWAIGQGIPADHADHADRYVRGHFQGVGRTLGDGTRSLHRLAADHETRTATTNASAPHGSPRPTPKPSPRPSTTSSPT
ncbi:hypothetical protein ACFYNF_08010 [Streptomyces sp. NPDC006641]|uniref:hypothetical protein n=1 Tax=unclassified Streptomyces TaxID=2593676 RepID=UPI0036905BED